MEPIHAARAASYRCHSNEGERRALCKTVSCSLYTLRAQQATVAIATSGNGGPLVVMTNKILGMIINFSFVYYIYFTFVIDISFISSSSFIHS
jgi:hypothetical protein